MTRARWRQVREGHEKEDRAYNEDLAEKLLSGPAVDDIVIALGVLQWTVTGPQGEKWMMLERRVLTPSWAVSVAQAEHDAYHGAHVAAAIDRHMPRPRAKQAAR
jgi:hypothetical protein